MDLTKIKTFEELKIAKNKFYQGQELKSLQTKIKHASFEDKKNLGHKISQLKQAAERAFAAKVIELKKTQIEAKIAEQWIDVTMPVEQNVSLHPVTLVGKRFYDWLIQNGYFFTSGPEIETEKYNFTRLNIGLDHPARDMHDTLYLEDERLLRTHNTGFSAQELEKYPNQAFSHFTIGKVYRNEEVDATHSFQFTQIDLVAVGNYSFPNLIWTLKSLMSYVLETEIEIRFRPSYFPFTEPSVEVDIKYNDRWLEVLGAGMLNQKVLTMAGYTNEMNGFAAGIGLERIAMIKYNITDIRTFSKNNLEFLNQFQGVK